MISRFTKQLKGALIVGALLVGSNAFAQLGLNWSEMGPNDIGGRCRSIIIDNTDPTGNKLFAAGVSGGIFKSSDAGANWMPVNDQAQSLIVSCMSQDASGNLFFGTGETFGRGGDAAGTTGTVTGQSGVLGGVGISGFSGTGLYKILVNTSTAIQVKDSAFFGNINEVAINANTIYVASQKGFFYSTDGGTTFTEETNSAAGNRAAMDVKFATNGDVYYSAGAKTSSTSAVYYAPFGSTVYTAITPTLITDRGRIEIAPSPVNPNYVYLSIAKQKTVGTSTVNTASGGLSAVLVSNDKGVNWNIISLGTAQFDPLTSGTKGVGDFANTIVADPLKVDACYLGGDVLNYWSQIPSNPLGQGNWSQVGNPASPSSVIYLHSKIHDLKFIPGSNSIYYVATDGGIAKVAGPPLFGDPSLTPFLAYNKGFNVSQFYSVTFPNYPRVTQGTPTNVSIPYAGIAGGTTGNSLTYLPGHLLNGPQTSSSFGSSDAYQSDFSKILPKAMFYSGASGSIFRTSDIDGSAPSTFYDASYNAASSGAPGSVTFANENTPMRLWENFGFGESAIFYNEIINANINTTNATQTTFTLINVRPQTSTKYDSILVTTKSSKKAFAPLAVTQTFTNSNTTASTFTINNTRTNTTSKYDSVTVRMTSFKKSNTVVIVPTFTNMSTTIKSFTLANIRPMASCKYDSIIIKATSTKSAVITPTVQTITIRPTYSLSNITGYAISGGPTGTANIVYLNNTTFNDSIRYTFTSIPNDSCEISVRIKYKYAQTIYIVPAYTGSLITSHSVIGEANTAANNNTITLNNTTLIDNIRYTFIDPPNDSSVISVRTKNSFYQTIKMMPVYTGSTISGYTIIGEANNTPTTNCVVKLNNTTLKDTIKYTFRVAPNDSCVISNAIKYEYDMGAVITLTNTDISGMQFTSSITLTSALAASITPQPIVYVPLQKSARLATGTSASASSGNSPSIFVVKRPLNFGLNPDWVRIAGQYSRVDSAGGTPYLAAPAATATVPILGTTVTRLEWAPNGECLYFSTRLNDTTYYLYRTSHLQFIGDEAAEDYSGIFSSDLDSLYNTSPSTTAYTRRKGAKPRTTPIGRFKNPITSIAVSSNNMNVMITCGGYKNVLGNVYYSNSDTRTMNLNNTDASNFTLKNTSTLPAYTGILEMSDNKKAIIGTEVGVYSTNDITVASPVWVKEGATSLPNVPVFQIRQQTLPSWQCYNSGIIYVGTHGRGIWSTDKFFAPYAIGIEEQETALTSDTNIKLFPNPASDNTTLWFKANGDAKYNVTVYDINGRVLIQQSTGTLMEGEQKLSLNTSELTAGIYFVTVNGTNNFNANSKLVITH